MNFIGEVDTALLFLQEKVDETDVSNNRPGLRVDLGELDGMLPLSRIASGMVLRNQEKG